MHKQYQSNLLRKAKTSLLEGLRIEIIADRITSGTGNNKKLKKIVIIKIRKRSPISTIKTRRKMKEIRREIL